MEQIDERRLQPAIDALRDFVERHGTGSVEVHVKDGVVRSVERHERIVQEPNGRPLAK